jgi:hypothetical protein
MNSSDKVLGNISEGLKFKQVNFNEKAKFGGVNDEDQIYNSFDVNDDLGDTKSKGVNCDDRNL